MITVKTYLGYKICISNLFDGSFIVIMPKAKATTVCTMAHFRTIEEAEHYIDVATDMENITEAELK